jgi:mono/diheme cytochrome c family protein
MYHSGIARNFSQGLLMARLPSKKPVRSQAIGRTTGIAIVVMLMVGIFGLTILANRTRKAPVDQPTDQISVGKRAYAEQCAICHGVNLTGQPNWQTPLPSGGRLAPPHDLTGPTWRSSDKQFFDVTKYGGQRFSPPDYKNFMPGYENRLSDEEIWAILAYIKSTWPPYIREAQAKLNQ